MDLCRALPIRIEPPPLRDWLVLRGGPTTARLVHTATHRTRHEFGRALLSTVVVAPPSLDIALRHRPLSRFARINFCFVRDVASNGFRLLPTFTTPHFSIELVDVDDLTIGRLLATLCHEMENPHAQL
ncbi:MAG: hypothetical protein EBT73_06435 [Actinobacteria bacterium]|nr:hypothetical protein [Actinomycetota bacterium]